MDEISLISLNIHKNIIWIELFSLLRGTLGLKFNILIHLSTIFKQVTTKHSLNKYKVLIKLLTDFKKIKNFKSVCMYVFYVCVRISLELQVRFK